MRAVASGKRAKRPTGGRGRRSSKQAKPSGRLSRRLVFGLAGLLVLSVGYIASTVGYGARLGDMAVSALSNTTDAAMQVFGVSVQDVTVNGRRFARAHEILDALGVDRGASMLSFDPVKARQRVLDVDWVRDATVSRLYPGTIHVNVTEYVPFAVWRQNGRTSIISETGQVVTERKAPWLAKLPVVDGAGAEKAAAAILPLLTQRPSLRARIRTIVRVGGRRWDLRLANAVKVMLPATQVATALDELIAINARTGLLERDIVFVDMRIPDRVTIRTTAGAVSKIGLGKLGSGTAVADKNT